MRWNGPLGSTRPVPITFPTGEIIFNCTGTISRRLFFYDTKHRYVYGLDPNYLYSENPELYKLLKDLTEGKIDDPAPMIREKFGANYIFADAKENTDMIAKALDSGWVEMIYEDDEARLLKIREVKGERPTRQRTSRPRPTKRKSSSTRKRRMMRRMLRMVTMKSLR